MAELGIATLGEVPPNEKEWIYEIKWDGYRALAFCNKQIVHLLSRNNKSFNDKFYAIRQTLETLNLNTVLDGEIVVVKESGVSSFEGLQDWRSEADGELVYYVFDILWLNGYDLTQLPLQQRKTILQTIVPKEGPIKFSASFDTTASQFLKAAKKMELEGMIAKKSDSTYHPGARSENWLKIKVQKRHEVVP